MRRFFCCKLTVALLGLLFLSASGGEISPQFAVAQKYADWARAVLARGEYEKALVFLEKARDYASSSSDLSFMLALTRHQCGKSADSVLNAALVALETDNWNNYKKTDALFLSAQMYVRLRRYDAALFALAGCEENAETTLLRLSALRGAVITTEPPGRASPAGAARTAFSPEAAGAAITTESPGMASTSGAARTAFSPEAAGAAAAAFRQRMGEALRQYPFNGEFSRMALLWAARHPANEADAELVSIALKGDTPAYLSAPFTGDEAAARHALRVWYAAQTAVIPEALPALLNFGVIDETHGLDALFGEQRINAAYLRAVFDLLRTDAAREDFRSRIHRFSGTMYEDYDDDGYVEAQAVYKNGILQSFSADVSQNGWTDIEVDAEAGIPVRARLGLFPAGQQGGFEPISPAFTEQEKEKHRVTYSAYPNVAKITAQGGALVFYFRPQDFYIKPVDFEDLGGPFGLPFPRLNTVAGGGTGGGVPDGLSLSEAALWQAAFRVEAPGKNFDGGSLVIELNNGRILSAKEYVNGVLAGEDFFTRGRLRERRIDMDLDGKLETKIPFPNQVFPSPVDYLMWLPAAD